MNVKLSYVLQVSCANKKQLLLQVKLNLCFNVLYQVRVRIGSPITGYGQESRNRAARQRIPNKVWTDEGGVEHVEVFINIYYVLTISFLDYLLHLPSPSPTHNTPPPKKRKKKKKVQENLLESLLNSFHVFLHFSSFFPVVVSIVLNHGSLGYRLISIFGDPMEVGKFSVRCSKTTRKKDGSLHT